MMPLNMTYSKSGIHLTEHFEGCKFVAYKDLRGIWTIAYGHTCGVYEGMTCTQAQADEWLRQDIVFAAACVNSFVLVGLSQEEFDALVDFVFNLGCGNFKHSTLLGKINRGDFAGAASELDKWDYVAGKQCAGLLRRREAEQDEFDA
jgi:lysozyme